MKKKKTITVRLASFIGLVRLKFSNFRQNTQLPRMRSHRSIFTVWLIEAAAAAAAAGGGGGKGAYANNA